MIVILGFIPWAGHDAEQIERQVCNQKMLKVNDSRVPTKFVDVLTYGLQPNANNRKMNLEQIRDVLSLMPRVRHMHCLFLKLKFVVGVP